VSPELERRWELERWISIVRLIAVPWALIEVGLVTSFSADRYEVEAWVVTGGLAVGALIFFWVGRRGVSARFQPAVCLTGLVFDTAVIWAYALVFTFESGAPSIRALLFFPVLEAALRYGLRGGLLLPVAQIPMLVAIEWWRSEHHAVRLQASVRHGPVRAPAAVGAVVGWLVNRLAQETAVAHERVGSGRLRAGPAGRSPGRHESLRTGARVVARDRRGLPRSFASCGRDPVDRRRSSR
jgi:hypothetical protein